MINLEKDYWYVSRSNDPRYQKVLDYIGEKSNDCTWAVYWNYVGRDGYNDNNGFNGFNGWRWCADRPAHCKEITLDRFLEALEPKFVLTENWCIKLDCDEAFKYANEYGAGAAAGSYSNSNFSGYIVHFPNFSSFESVSSRVINGYTLISQEDFLKHIYKKPESKMKVQTLTRKQLIELYHSDSCVTWRDIITSYINSFGKYALDDSIVEIKQVHINKLIKSGTKQQIQRVKDLDIVLIEDNNLFVSEFEANFLNDKSNKMFGNMWAFSIYTGTEIERLNKKSLFVPINVEIELHEINRGTIIEFKKK